jgi:TonB-dependent Receptor Plug Domain
MVDVTQSKVETTISSEMLQQMPKGRSFQSVIPFAPGARQEPLQSLATLNGATTPNAAGNANIGGNSARANGFQIDGASDAENVYLMDGINITNIQGGGVGSNVPFDFIQELQVKSSSFEAEYGGALGGVINAIEKQGSNKWHGNFNFSYISSALNANDRCT